MIEFMKSMLELAALSTAEHADALILELDSWDGSGADLRKRLLEHLCIAEERGREAYSQYLSDCE